jgi:serine/arginine repetitive matrix protein 2
MATKTQHPPSTFSRIRFGFGPKQSPSPHDPPEHENDDDWYLPYNGPYELPPTSPPLKNRDSWEGLLGPVLANPASAKSSEMGHEWPGGRMASGQTIMSALPSSGAYGSHPYRTTAATDAAGPTQPPSTTGFPGRGPTSQALRSGRPTIATSSTAFANIDSTGGVGESPTPVQRFSPLHTSPAPSSRISLANFLIFGGSSRKSRSDSLPSSRQSSRKRRPRDRSLDPLQSNRATATATTTSDAHRPSRSHSPLSLSQAMERGPRQRTHTLMGTSTAAAKTPSPSHESHVASSFYSRESPLSSHPYAHPFSASRTGPPRRAIAVPPALLSLDKGKGVDRSRQYPPPSAPDALTNTRQVPAHLRPASRTSLFKTISAPNLRNFSRDFSMSKHIPSRGKSRWLSPETWCDALLFPRPRFLEYIDDDPPYPFNDQQPSPIRPPEMTRTIRKPPRPLRMALRGSQSAVNLLAPNSGSSRGPPRADPLLMVRRESTDADGQSSPGRPLSFAQDDIALPSPVLSLTRLVPSVASHIMIPTSTDFTFRVLEMRTSFEHERAEWKAQAARSLQSSKLTRSLGRSRSQSAGRARAQLKDMGGVEFLATKTLLGNQLAAPTVHARTPSDGTHGTHGTQTRSGTSHAHTNSSGGCSASKSRAALRAATGLCVSDGKISPQDERNDGFSRIDSRGKGVRTEAAAPSAEVPSTPSPQVTNNLDVGVALSSPLPSPEVDPRVPTKSSYVQDHPHVQSGGGRSQHGRSGSDYAGPHPSAVAIAPPPTAITSDMFARHRLPPHAALHPYAAISTCPNTTSSQNPAAAHPKGSYTAPPEDAPPPWLASQEPPKSRPQLSDVRETRRMGAHAYASASASGSRVSSGEPLAFADALSYGLRRRGSADSGLGESENHFGGTSAGATTTPLYTPIPNLVLTSMVDHPLDSAPAAPDSAFLSSSRSGHAHTVASSNPPEPPNPPTFTASALPYSFPSHSGQASLLNESIAAGSGSSSPQRSPRPFSSIEDLDRYRNLFYRPRGSGSSRTPSGEHRRVLSRETTNGGGNGGSSTGQDVSSNSPISGSVGSGLSALARQLNNEWEGSGGGLLGSSPPQVWGLRGLMGNDGMGSRTEPNAVLSITSASEMNSSSPGAGTTTLPFSLHRSFSLSEGSSLIVPIPQDVESRPTSSMLDRSEMEGDHDDDHASGSLTLLTRFWDHTDRLFSLDDVGLLRMGTVEAITTPSATVPPTYRLSFTGDVHGGLSQESLSISRSQSQSQLRVDATANNDSSASLLEPPPPLPMASSTGMSPRRRSSRSSLLPAGLPSATTEVTRSSYLTDGTGASRISGLSDFPAPPSQTVVPSDRVELLKSYFDDGSGSDASGNVHSRPVSSQIDRSAKASGAEGSVRSRRQSSVDPSRLSKSRERPARGADHDAT